MSTKPPSGTRDFLPDDIRKREHVMRVVRDVYESYGFEPLETPAFENIETLLGKYGEEGNRLIFKILKRGEHEASGEADLALRYDLTVPLARVVAQYQAELPRFFKRYQIQPVWRADRPARGRFREFYQCDIDAIGSTSPVVEAELIGAVSEVLGRLGFEDFVRLMRDALVHHGGSAHREGEGGNIADDQPCAEFAKRARFTGRTRHEITVERGRAADAVRFVERQRIDLHHARIRLQRAEGDLALDGQIEQPPRRRRADANARFGPAGEHGIDDFDRARRVTESVTGDVEDDRLSQSVMSPCESENEIRDQEETSETARR